MVRYFIYITFLILSADLLQAQPVIICGNAPSYAGEELVFYTLADHISQTEKELKRCKIDSSGDFHLEIQAVETMQVYANLGIYKAILWIEPHQEYRVVLPEKEEKTTQELLNPFFEPLEIHLGLENFREDELNVLIMMFNDAYNPYYNKHVNDIYLKSQPGRIDDDIEQIEKIFGKYSNPFFEAYRQYSYGQLKLLAYSQKVKSLSQEYFTGKPVLYSHPAYMDLFDQVYEKYFTFFARTETGGKMYDDINHRKCYSSLLQTLSADSNILGDTLREMVILKSIYDEFYSTEFSRNGLLSILDSLVASSKIAKHKEIGLYIKHKITRLQPGYDPPFFELYDADSNLVKLTDFKGRYVYINFCTSTSYACINEFELLNNIHQRHHQRLTIITISTDPHEETFNQFKRTNNYQWIFLYYGHQPEVLKEYDIRAYPTYFLIGPDGKLVYSPAPAPSENFETRLFEVMKARGDL
ncbi:MAG: TlpA family protein disulfide reductase [Bacteroidales bacterium]|nr:TlpA family protein disulfide reductase [Bacteroidales bacterium]